MASKLHTSSFFLIKDKKEWKYFIPFFLLAEIIADYGAFTTIEALQFGIINVLETSIAALLIKKFSKNKEQNFLAFFIALISVYYTSNLVGPFSIFEAKETTIYLQEYIALLFIITLFFGVLHKELSDSKKELEELNNTLEIKKAFYLDLKLFDYN